MGSLINGAKKPVNKYATDSEGMLHDAKQYAKKDFSQTLELFKELDIEVDEETIANALIQVKLNRITKSRTERRSYFD